MPAIRYLSSSRVFRVWLSALVISALCLIVAATSGVGIEAASPPTFCGLHIEKRPQTVAVAPDLSRAGLTLDDIVQGMEKWNVLWQKYWGFPAFVLHSGAPQDADIFVTASGWDGTWVQGAC